MSELLKRPAPSGVEIYRNIHDDIETRPPKKPLHWLPASLFKITLFILGFLFPLPGMLAWILMRESQPHYARFIGLGTLLGYIFNIVLNIYPRFYGFPIW